MVGHRTVRFDHMPENKRVTIRLEEELLEKIELLVETGDFKNTSEAIREAISLFLEERVSPPNIEKFTIELSKGQKVKLEQLVEGGDAVSVNDAIREAVRDYTKERFDQMIMEIRQMEKYKKLKEEES